MRTTEFSYLSTGFYRNSEVCSHVCGIFQLSTDFFFILFYYIKLGDYSSVDSTLHLLTGLHVSGYPSLFKSYFLGPFWIPICFISVYFSFLVGEVFFFYLPI